MNTDTQNTISRAYAGSDAGLAQDESPAVTLRKASRRLHRKWTRKYNEIAEELSSQFTVKTLSATDKSLQKKLDEVGFSVQFRMTEDMRNAYQATIGENVGLIRSIPEQYLTQVETLAMQSVTAGRDLKALTDSIQHQYAVTKRRAELIARDQNNKATTDMLSARQRSIGATRGIWRHSHAGKNPREDHVKADGEEFDLTKGLLIKGKYVLPGKEINCRCGWDMVLPGFNQ
ncbi:phage minor head protein [Klebsiella quasivariicola]|uniref:phage head morphogenesis protein n=1 Tax=Klebsiella quasivariicola TaxID=2026240 RepID=UPI00247A663E|nr:phage minor head protein [Klebsiella quasivariicola]